MSSPLPSGLSQASERSDALAALRGELDDIDDRIHDLLIARGAVVERVAALDVKGRVALRPGREADILRRLIGRHHGALSVRLLSRLWRELFAATTAMQGSYSIAVCEAAPAEGAQFTQVAREHFGALTPLRVHRSPLHAIGEVSGGSAVAAVLPLPAEDEPQAAAWWTALLHRDDPRIHIVARLPFWAPRPEGAPRARAMVVAAVAPDRSARDRSLIGLELPVEMSRTRLSTMLTAAGLTQLDTIIRRAPGAHAAFALVEIDGFVADDDPRLSTLSELPRPPVVLGAYAVPLEQDP